MLFVVLTCALLRVSCSLCLVPWCSFLIGCCLLFVDGHVVGYCLLLFAMCCALCLVRWSVFAVPCSLFVACCSVCVGCWFLFVGLCLWFAV